MSNARTANLLGALALAVSDRMVEAVTGLGNGNNAISALVAIYHHPGESVRSLQRTLSLTHSGTVRILDGLAKDGLIERRRGTGDDQREVALWPTQTGQERVRDILQSRNKALQQTLKRLSPDDQMRLTSLLEIMLAEVTHGRQQARRICRLCDEGVCRSRDCPVEQAASSGKD